MILVDSSVWIGYFNGALTRQEIAVQAARNFRTLRKLGITLRKTIDTIIATRCIWTNTICCTRTGILSRL